MLRYKRKRLQKNPILVSDVISGMGMIKINTEEEEKNNGGQQTTQKSNIEELKKELKKLDISNNRVKKNKRYVKF